MKADFKLPYCVNLRTFASSNFMPQICQVQKMAQLRKKPNKLELYDISVERDAGDNWVTQSSALVRSAQGLTLAEKRLVMLAVSKIDSRKTPPKAGESPVVKITAAEYAEVMGVDSHTAYDQLKSASRHLYHRSLRFFEPSFRRKTKTPVFNEVNMRWVAEAHYHKNEAWVELHFWHRLVPHLMGLQKHFVTYQLKSAVALRSIYSWRMLELLTRFEKTGIAEYTIEDFALSMDATEKQRSNFNNIRRRIIEPAVKELNSKDGWDIEWEPIKRGRKVVTVRFTFKKKAQLDMLSGT